MTRPDDPPGFDALVADLRRWIRRIEHGHVLAEIDVEEGCVAAHRCRGERMTSTDYQRVMREPPRAGR